MAERPMFPCAGCDAVYPSYLAALDCADQDAMEQDDRNHQRLYGINRSVN
jgi:hypothetical protein